MSKPGVIQPNFGGCLKLLGILVANFIFWWLLAQAIKGSAFAIAYLIIGGILASIFVVLCWNSSIK